MNVRGIRRIARASATHPWRTIGIWLAVIALSIGASATLLAGGLTSDFTFTNQPESLRGQRVLEDRLTGPERITEVVIVRSAGAVATEPRFRALVSDIRGDVARLGEEVVVDVRGPFAGEGPPLVSRDGTAALITITMAGTFDEAKANVSELHAVTIERDLPRGFEVFVAGRASIDADATELSERDLRKGEGFGMPIALLVLIAVFGAVVAAFVPIGMALAGIISAVGLVALFGTIFKFQFFAVNMITMMGLAVGIDYSLFVVSRYREERARGRGVLDAVERAGATATRAVFFSGATVVLALVGMFLVPTTIFRSLAAGAIFVVITSVAASMTLLPAIVRLLGDRLEKGHIPLLNRRARAEGQGFWDRTSRAVMRRPVVSLVLAGGLLIGAALPVLGLQTGLSGVSTMPDYLQSKRAFAALSESFQGGLTEPTTIVIDAAPRGAAVRAGVRELRAALAADERFGPSRAVRAPDAGLTVVSAPVNGDPFGSEAVRAIKDLRARAVPAAFDGVDADVLVTGQTAFAVDMFSTTDRYTPIVFAFVLGLSFLLLMVVFRSIVVPAKAIVMNLLSVGAAYGLIVLVQQKGYGAGVLGFQQVDKIEAWLPLFLFSVLFGLSMDYHVFLLSRIKERYDATGDNTEAVAFGLRTTGRIITGAALIMVAVFAGFAAGDMTSMQQMGFGLGVAVLLDATIVRSVLVPASMRLLGERNWYLPRWLEWLPQIHIEGMADDEEIVLPTGGVHTGPMRARAARETPVP